MPARAANFAFQRKRGGQTLSKGRFLGAQMEAYLADGLWLHLAERANASARRLARGLVGTPGVRLAWPTEANEVFVVAPSAMVERWRSAGAVFHEWSTRSLAPERAPRQGETLVRLVASFETASSEIDRTHEPLRRRPALGRSDAVTAPHSAPQIVLTGTLERQSMTNRMDGALRLCLAGSALGGLIAFAFVPAATAQWLGPWQAASPGEIERSLEAQGYGLIAPLVRRPGIYLADVSAGRAGYQRLVIDARSGQILERFIAPGRTWGPALAARDEEFGEPRPPRRRTAAESRVLRPAHGRRGEIGLWRSSEHPHSGSHQSVWCRGSAGRNEAQAEVHFDRTQVAGDQTHINPTSAASGATRSGEAGRIGLASVQAGGEP